MPRSFLTVNGTEYCSIPVAATRLKTSRTLLVKSIRAGRVPAFQHRLTGQLFLSQDTVADLVANPFRPVPTGREGTNHGKRRSAGKDQDPC